MKILFEDKKLLLKYKEIWKIIQNILKRKEFNSKLAFTNQYLRTKIKSYSFRVATIFKNFDNDNNEVLKGGVTCICGPHSFDENSSDKDDHSNKNMTFIILPLLMMVHPLHSDK